MRTIYLSPIRPHLGYCTVIFNSLSMYQANRIERVQKQAFRVILGPDYISYEVACTVLWMEPLSIRRIQLCLNFAKKEVKRDQSLFTKAHRINNNRSTPKLVEEYRCRTKRFQKSSMPFLSRLLNDQQ